MDIEVAKIWLQVLNMVGTALIGAWMYLEKRSNKTNERIDELTLRFEELDHAMRAVKSDTSGHLRHTDMEDLRRENKDDMGKLYTRINSIDNKMNQMIGEFKASNDLLRMLFNQITVKGLE
jgi:prefoldin subunit 5